MRYLAPLILLLVGRCHAFAPRFAATSPSLLASRHQEPPSTALFMAEDDNDDDVVPKKEKKEPYMSEAEAGRRLDARMNLPARIGDVFTKLTFAIGISFLVADSVLPIFGYSLVKGDNGRITIGTMDTRNFQKEIIRVTKEDQEKANNLVVSPSSAE